MMTAPVFANDRFLSQPVTGVQRFSAEIVGALYVDTTAPQSITMALERLLEEAGLAAELRARGLQRVGRLRWDGCARKLTGAVQAVS